MKTNVSTKRIGLFGAVVLSIVGGSTIPLSASNGHDAIPPSQIFGHFVGRAIVTNSGDLEVVGYYVFLEGVSSPFFNGPQGESTAFFTFRSGPLVFSDVFTNGSIAWAIEQAGATYSVYFNPSPKGDWSNPDSFSSGQLIATFTRLQGFFTCSGDLNLLNTCSQVQSYTLTSSADFVANGQKLNFDDLVPFGVNTIAPMLDTSFPGFAAVFVGYQTANGRSQN